MNERKPVLPRRISKALLLFILPLPLLAELLGSLVKAELTDVLFSALGLAGFFGAGALMRQGLLEEAVLAARHYIVRPPRPLKLIGSLLAGVTTAVVSHFLVESHAIWESLLYGAAAVLGCVLLYGPDPRPRWSADAMDRAQREEVMAALASAEEQVLAIEHANDQIAHPELTMRLDRVCDEARDILAVLAKKPSQVRRARRFLNAYLDGARQVADGYARTHARAGSQELEASFRGVLDTIESAFAEQHRKLLEDEVMDLDVSIEVLKTRLEKEGV